MDHRRRWAALALALALGAGLAGCGSAQKSETAEPTQTEPVAQAPEWTTWSPIETGETAQGEVCFALSAQELIRRCNVRWAEAWGEDLLPPLDQWMAYGVGTLSRRGGVEGRQYQSLQDPGNYAEPFLSLCLAQEEDRVLEVVTGLSQKNYTGAPTTLFQAKSLCALQAFFPDLTEADFAALYEALSQNARYAETWETPLPARVAWQDGVACYLLLQIGEYDQFHIRPADPALLAQWRAAGVEVTEGICPISPQPNPTEGDVTP